MGREQWWKKILPFFPACELPKEAGTMLHAVFHPSACEAEDPSLSLRQALYKPIESPLQHKGNFIWELNHCDQLGNPSRQSTETIPPLKKKKCYTAWETCFHVQNCFLFSHSRNLGSLPAYDTHRVSRLQNSMYCKAHQKEVVRRFGSFEDKQRMPVTAVVLGIESGLSKRPLFLIRVQKGYGHMA